MLLNTELQYRWCSRVMVSHTQIVETQRKQILQNALLQTLNNCVVGNQINLLRVRAGFSLGEKIPTVSFPGKKSNIGPKWEPTGAWIRIRQFHAPLCENGSQYGIPRSEDSWCVSGGRTGKYNGMLATTTWNRAEGSQRRGLNLCRHYRSRSIDSLSSFPTLWRAGESYSLTSTAH